VKDVRKGCRGETARSILSTDTNSRVLFLTAFHNSQPGRRFFRDCSLRVTYFILQKPLNNRSRRKVTPWMWNFISPFRIFSNICISFIDSCYLSCCVSSPEIYVTCEIYAHTYLPLYLPPLRRYILILFLFNFPPNYMI